MHTAITRASETLIVIGDSGLIETSVKRGSLALSRDTNLAARPGAHYSSKLTRLTVTEHPVIYSSGKRKAPRLSKSLRFVACRLRRFLIASGSRGSGLLTYSAVDPQETFNLRVG